MKKKRQKEKEQAQTDAPANRKVAVAEMVSSKTLILCSGIAAAFAFLLYLPSVWFDFTYDDVAVVSMNQFVHKGFGGIKEILTNDYFKGFDPAIKNMVYRPVPLLMFAVEHEFFGLNPHVNHLGNIIIYALTAFFLFLTLQRLFRDKHPILPFIITLLFVAHPIHVEVVANIKSRDELSGFLNFLISFWLLLQFLDGGKKIFFALSILFYFIALASKESMLTTLAVIPLALYFFRNYKISKIALYSSAYLAVFLVFLAIRNSVLGGTHDPTVVNYLDNPLLGAKTFNERWATNFVVLGMYLKHLLFPHPLVSDYSYNSIPLVGWSNYKAISSLLAYGGLIYFVIDGFSKKRLYTFGILFYFITLSIFSSVFVPNFNAYADRFLYTPALGFCIAIGGILYYFIKNDVRGMAWIKRNIIPLSLFAVLIFLYSFKTETRLPDWKNNWTLFTADLPKVPDNSRMRKNYAGELVQRAMNEPDAQKKKDMAEEAIKEVKIALSFYPRFIEGYLHLGNAHFILGDYHEAEKAYLNVLKISPRIYLALSNLANIYYRMQRYEESMQMLEKIDRNRWSESDKQIYSKNKQRLGR